MDEPRNGQTTEAKAAGSRDPNAPVDVKRLLVVVGCLSGVVALGFALVVGVKGFLHTGTVRPEALAIRLLLAVGGFWVAVAVTVYLTTRNERAWTNAWLGHVTFFNALYASVMTLNITNQPSPLLFRCLLLLFTSAVMGVFQAVAFPYSRLFHVPPDPKPPNLPPDDLYDPAPDARR